MASSINLKNSGGSTLAITHSDSKGGKTIIGTDIVTSVATINDFPSVGIQEGDTVIVKDANRGGTFILKTVGIGIADNGGTTFTSSDPLMHWTRQYEGAVNVKWFGAVGNNIINDTVAITNAISMQGDIFIPRATFRVSGLTITAVDDFTLFGDGELALLDNSNTAVITLNNCTNFTINGLSFDGNKANQVYNGSRNSYAGISINGVNSNRFSIINNRVHDTMAGAAILAITGGSNKSNSLISNNKIYDAGTATELSDGIYINSGYAIVENNTIHGVSDYGIAADYAENLILRNNNIDNVLVGIGVLGANNWLVSGNIIDNSELGIAVTLSGNSPVEPYISHDVDISNNTIINTTRNISGTPNGDGIFVDPSASNVSISENKIINAYRGIASGANGTVITNNTVTGTIVSTVGIFNSAIDSVSLGNRVGSGILEQYFDKTNKFSMTSDGIQSDNRSENVWTKKTLPTFYCGDSGINDEYLVLGRYSDASNSIDGQGMFGDIYLNKNNLYAIAEIEYQTATNTTSFRKHEAKSYGYNFGTLDILTLSDGLPYLALKAPSSGGTSTEGYFRGILKTSNDFSLTRVRLSDAGVSVTTADKYPNSYILTYGTTINFMHSTATEVVAPNDNLTSLGTAAKRWSTVYAGTGTINTSDDREKTYLTIDEIETLVAKELKGLVKKFKFNDAIEAKGDEARIHYGTSAQGVISVFKSHGLDPMKYAMICYDEWEEETDEAGNVTQEAGNRYGIRYEELIMFILGAM